MMRVRVHTALVVLLTLANSAWGTEPNETFAKATVLGSGVLSVADELTEVSPYAPDTLLGIRDLSGDIYYVDDDGSIYGDDYASGAMNVSTNSGSIDFAVSGFGDDDFIGSHSESGYYEVFVDAYDFFGDLVDSFSEVRLLQPGIVHEFSYADSNWINGSYDVNIDNTSGTGGTNDVDFFTFTGLTPGAAFVAQTMDPDENGIDTYLGWFGSGGTLLAAHDDIDYENGNFLSLLEGTVPTNGMLTFAVTGFGDDEFDGVHDISGTYELQLEIAGAGLPGDFNNDSIVNAADYVVWRKALGTTYTSAHFNIWRANFGETAGAGATFSVPECSTVALALFGWAIVILRQRK